MNSLCKQIFKKYWKLFVVILTPIILLILPLTLRGDQRALSAYLLGLVAVYWVTEALPLGATSLIPLFLAPMMGLRPLDEVAHNYMKASTVSLMGSVLCALAIEKSGLHKRIALKILLALGPKFKWLLLGFMVPTFLLSMFVVNTAAAATMLPMVEALLDQLSPASSPHRDTETGRPHESANRNGTIVQESDATSRTKAYTECYDPILREMDVAESTDIIDISEMEMKVIQDVQVLSDATPKPNRDIFVQRAQGLTLACVHAANIGGIATLTGTTPNLIMKQYADDYFQSKGMLSPINYATWMIYGVPIAVIILLLNWFWLLLLYGWSECFTCKSSEPENEAATIRVVASEYHKLGPIRYNEVMVLLLFGCLVLLWFFRAPGFIPGWASQFKQGYVQTGVPAILISIALFVLPSQLPSKRLLKDSSQPDTLLDWKTVQHKFPWAMFFLFGGGYALADITMTSGLSSWLGAQLSSLARLPGPLLVITLCLLVAVITEVLSNPAACTLLMPVVIMMAESLNINPLFLMLPVTVSTSFAFMLPVATPPNALAFVYGRVKTYDMVKAGAFVNVYCVLVVTLATYTWGNAYFELDSVPWNVTTQSTLTTPPEIT